MKDEARYGPAGKTPPIFLYVVLVVIGDSIPAGKGEKKELEIFAKTSDIGWKKKELQVNVTLSYLLEIDVLDHYTAAVIPANYIHPLQTHHQLQNHNTAQQSFNRTSRLLP